MNKPSQKDNDAPNLSQEDDLTAFTQALCKELRGHPEIKKMTFFDLSLHIFQKCVPLTIATFSLENIVHFGACIFILHSKIYRLQGTIKPMKGKLKK